MFLCRRLCFFFGSLTAACASGQQAIPDGPSVRRPDDYDQLLRQAQSFIEAGQAEGGAELAQKASAERPEEPAPYVLLGRALAMLNELEESAEAYEKARSLGSQDRRLFSELASVYDVSRRYDEAVAVYRDFLETRPEDAEMIHELGLTLILVGRSAEGVEYLRRAVALSPADPRFCLDLGFGLLQAKRLQEAAQVLSTVSQKNPDMHLAWQFLAQVRVAQGRNREALLLLDKAVAIGKTDPRPVRLRAQLRVVMGDHQGALGDYQLLVKADPDDAGALVGAAGALINLDRLAEAQQAVDRLRTLLGDQPHVAFRAAQIAWRQGDVAAVATIEDFATKHPKVLEAWRELVAAARAIDDRALKKRAQKRVEQLEKK